MQYDMPEYLEWIRPGKQSDINEEYADYLTVSIPKSDAPDRKIKEYIADALEAERAAIQDLHAKGYGDEDAEAEATLWPLKKDAPLKIARELLQFHEDMIESLKAGIV